MEPTGAAYEVDNSELETAQRDFGAMLRRKRLPRPWIAEHADELLSQAWIEYTAKLAKGEQVDCPAGWLINCAWWRALDLLRSQKSRPQLASLETAFHLADESTPTPEQQALGLDRDEGVRKVLAHLPDKDCELLALVYFEDYSVREAGRKVGWQKSTADRHHTAALEKLHALLGDSRSLPSPASVGLAAWILVNGEGHSALDAVAGAVLAPARWASASGAELASTATQRLGELWRKLSPLTDPGAAAATSGGGRALGACGVAAATVLCSVAASSVVPAFHAAAHHAPAHRAGSSKPKPNAGPSPNSEYVALPSSSPGEAASAEAPTAPQQRHAKAVKAAGVTQPRQAPQPGAAPKTGAEQTTSEFGVEASSTPAAPATPAPQSESQGSSQPATAPSRPAARPSGTGSAPSSSGSSEFGL